MSLCPRQDGYRPAEAKSQPLDRADADGCYLALPLFNPHDHHNTDLINSFFSGWVYDIASGKITDLKVSEGSEVSK